MLKEYWDTLLTAVFPDRCLFCDEVVPPKVLCCKYCLQELPHRPPQSVGQEGGPCSWVTAPFDYRDGVRHAIGQMKFHGRPEAADFFVPHMLEAVRCCGGEDYLPDAVVPVPMEEGRLAERGYNQAELLARGLACALGAPCRTDLLLRCTDIAQHDLSSGLRAVNARRSFRSAPAANTLGMRILLVDDVYTTGNSIARCAALLTECGAAEVACVVAAITPPESKKGKKPADFPNVL